MLHDVQSGGIQTNAGVCTLRIFIFKGSSHLLLVDFIALCVVNVVHPLNLPSNSPLIIVRKSFWLYKFF